MEQYGTMEVVNHTTGHKAILTFKPAGWASKDLHRVEGFITDKKYILSSFLMDSFFYIISLLFLVRRSYISSMANGLNL